MPKVTICAQVSEAHYHALVGEAERRGVAVETLVEQSVNALIRELEDETGPGVDPTVNMS